MNTGEPAFPTARVHINGIDLQDGIQTFGTGMTLRDYFAAKAMQGIASIPLPTEATMFEGGLCRWISVNSYAIADAMLKAREQ